MNLETEIVAENEVDLSADEADIHVAEQHEMYLIDKYALVHEAKEKGEKNAKIEIAKKLLERNIDLEDISISTGLSKEELSKLK